MVNTRLIFLFFIISLRALGQESVPDSSRSVLHQLKTETGILISAKDRLPFWLKANNSNRFTDHSANSIYQLLDYSGSYQLIDKLRIGWELESIVNLREKLIGRFVQANIRIETNYLVIKGGYDEELFGLNDSTLSIGNLVYGNNARPLPKISISTNGWKKSPVLGKVFTYRAYLAHGQFEDNRFQSGAFLHQKYFYLRGRGFKNRLSLIFGLNHNAQWGGSNSLAESAQPAGIKNLTKIFIGSSGGNDALLTDQLNALGNHLGSYDMRGSFDFKNFKISNYWQFLWEDKSGLTPFNWRDGLMGVSIDLKNKGILQKINLEIVRTNDQNAQKVANDGTPIFEPDNFFNNGIYRTGWSYHNTVIGNPTFLILNPESTSTSRIKNSINAFNIGVSGNSGNLSYRLQYIDFKNKGTKQELITPSLRMKAVNVILEYRLNKQASLGSRINYQDANFDSQRNFGFQIFYKKSFLAEGFNIR